MQECSCESLGTVFSVTGPALKKGAGRTRYLPQKVTGGTRMGTGKCLVKQGRGGSFQAKETAKTKAQLWEHAWQVQKEVIYSKWTLSRGKKEQLSRTETG